MDTIKFENKNIKLIAHRGLSGLERENTYPAFVAAGNRNYYAIETDIRKTSDGKFIAIHDESTDRVTLNKIKLSVRKTRYSKLKSIVLPDLDESLTRQDIRIPLLNDYIKICKKYGKVSVLELKDELIANDIKNIINEIKSEDYLDKVIFISFSLKSCIELRKLLPENDIQWLIIGNITEYVINTLKAYRLTPAVSYKQLKKEEVDNFHSLGMKVNCWTCDKLEDAEKLSQMGVDFITTNILEPSII